MKLILPHPLTEVGHISSKCNLACFTICQLSNVNVIYEIYHVFWYNLTSNQQDVHIY